MSSSLGYCRTLSFPFHWTEVVPYKYLMTWRWDGIKDMFLLQTRTALRLITDQTPANDNRSAK